MNQSDLIETTCSEAAPAISEFNIGTIDRFGNELPTIIIASDQTLNWKARDYRDQYLSQLTAPNSTKEVAIDILCDSLSSAGLISRFRVLLPIIGDNAIDNSLNLAYPFDLYSQKVNWIGSPIHDKGSVQGNGTTAYGLIGLNSFDVPANNYSLGFYSLQTYLNNIGAEMGFGSSWDNGTYLHLNNSATIGGTPAFCNKAYFNKLQFVPADGSGLFIGNVNSVKRSISRNGGILVSSLVNLGIHTGIGFPLTLMQYNNAFSTRRFGFFFVAEAFSDVELVDFNSIIQTFISGKGAVITL